MMFMSIRKQFRLPKHNILCLKGLEPSILYMANKHKQALGYILFGLLNALK